MIIEKVRIKMVKEGEMDFSKKRICEASDVSEILYEYLEGADREFLGVITLSADNKPINITTVSMGSLTSSVVHPREVFKTAILSNACSIILFHNHPSGCLKPSKSDIVSSKRIAECGDVLGIELLDSIIIGNNKSDGYYSMAEYDVIF